MAFAHVIYETFWPIFVLVALTGFTYALPNLEDDTRAYWLLVFSSVAGFVVPQYLIG